MAVLGQAAEIFVHKLTGAPWPMGPIGDRTVPDVGPYQVRGRAKRWYDLLMHSRDKDDDVFILVTWDEDSGTFCAHGWVWGWEGKQERHIKDVGNRGYPDYFVEQRYLHPMSTLPHWTTLMAIQRFKGQEQ